MRSRVSSRPTCRRSAWPSACHLVAVRALCRIERNDEALVAAPGIAHAEQLEAVQHGGEGGLRRGLQNDREKPARAGEVALPQRVARMRRKAGCSTRATSDALRASSRPRCPDLPSDARGATSSVRTPRRPRKVSSEPGQTPRTVPRLLDLAGRRGIGGRDGAQHRVRRDRRCIACRPSIDAETPCSNGLKK